MFSKTRASAIFGNKKPDPLDTAGPSGDGRKRATMGGAGAGKTGQIKGIKIKNVQSSGYTGLAKSFSLPTVGERKDVRRGTDNVPVALKKMDYWQAMNYFDVFDVRKKGSLNRTQWFKMIASISRDTEIMTKTRTDEIFDVVDLDGNGDIDKEEFLSWVFNTNSNYCTNMRKRLGDMEPRKVYRFFEEHDFDGNGTIDVDEFCEMIDKLSPESSLTHQSIVELFSFIDVDGSGEIDAEEFLDWVHPWRKADPEDIKKLVKKGHTEEKAALFEMDPKTPVNLIFTIGFDFEATLAAIKGELRRVYSNRQVQVVAEYDNNVKRCARLVAMVGRGIILWDRPTMLPYIEDPFYSVQSARNWILKVLKERLPDLMGAANIKHLQKQRMMSMAKGEI